MNSIVFLAKNLYNNNKELIRLLPQAIEKIFPYLLNFLLIAISLPVHESAHGYIAYKLGDPTAKNQGRLTLNPIKHFSIPGAISMLVFGIGWANPVPVNPYYFKNRKTGMAITSLAGPMSNILLALIFMIIYKVLYSFNVMGILLYSFFYLCYGNIRLAIFNLIPVPPFDGSRIFNLFLPEKYYFQIMKYERYIFIGIFLLLFTGILTTPLNISTTFFIGLLDKLTFFI